MTAPQLDLDIYLLGPQYWQSLWHTALQPLSEREQTLAWVVLKTLHSRHVGITPALISQLVPALLNPAKRPSGAWQVVFDRLLHELLPPGQRQSRYQEQRYGLVLGSAPSYVILRLVLPVVQRACLQLGYSYLFCQDPLPNDPGVLNRYESYSQDLSQTIIKLSRDYEPASDSFWQAQALTLSHLSQPDDRYTASDLPTFDPTAFQLMTQLQPKVPALRKQNRRRPRQFLAPRLHQKSTGRREGGVTGVQFTTRLDDIDDISLSEFANPTPILSDRLANAGYLARQRNPRQTQQQPALIVGLLPGQSASLPSAALVKACWFELSLRLSHSLVSYNLAQSAFRWIEGDKSQRAKLCTFPLQEMPFLPTVLSQTTSEVYRHEFLSALRWMPTYLNANAHSYSLKSYPDYLAQLNQADPLSPVLAWILAVWDSQDSITTQAEADKVLLLRQFSALHLMLFLPASLKGRQAASSTLGSLFNRLKTSLNRQSKHRPNKFEISITWLPAQPAQVKDWQFDTPQRPRQMLYHDMPTALDLNNLAGKLVYTWLKHLNEEILRDD